MVFTAEQQAFLANLAARSEWRGILEALERDVPELRSWKAVKDDRPAGEHYAYLSGEMDRHRRILYLLGNREK